jgi:hypothetical protein
VTLPASTRVAYKFRIVLPDNSVKWVVDPNAAKSESDGLGGQNSVLDGVTCGGPTLDGGVADGGALDGGVADAGQPSDGGSQDAAIGGDGGQRPKPQPGCACQLGGQSRPLAGWLAWSLVAVVLIVRQRRRAAPASD